MRLIKPDILEKYIVQMYADTAIKFISIGDYWYAIDHIGLVNSGEFKSLKTTPFFFTSEMLKSFPAPRRPLSEFPVEILESLPIIMFESTIDEGRYYRYDGRHRIMKANQIGQYQLPAKWVPKSLYGRFIIGREVQGQRYQHMPYRFIRQPEHEHTEFGWHEEPSFEIPFEVDDAPSKDIKPMEVYSSNCRMSVRDPFGQCYKTIDYGGVQVYKRQQ